MTHSGNNNWCGEHEQTISKDDEERGIAFCSNALVWDMLEGKEQESKNRNSYLQWVFKSTASHFHALFTKGKVNRNIYWTHFPGNVCRGLLRKIWQTDLQR